MWDQCQVTAGPSKNLHINQTSRDVYASVIQFPQKQFMTQAMTDRFQFCNRISEKIEETVIP